MTAAFTSHDSPFEVRLTAKRRTETVISRAFAQNCWHYTTTLGCLNF
ncbi:MULTISPECIES: hypothetical protein [Kitasatospora]|nr:MULTISPECIES: hypothetical protein [Kitasatospora]